MVLRTQASQGCLDQRTMRFCQGFKLWTYQPTARGAVSSRSFGFFGEVAKQLRCSEGNGLRCPLPLGRSRDNSSRGSAYWKVRRRESVFSPPAAVLCPAQGPQPVSMPRRCGQCPHPGMLTWTTRSHGGRLGPRRRRDLAFSGPNYRTRYSLAIVACGNHDS